MDGRMDGSMKALVMKSLATAALTCAVTTVPAQSPREELIEIPGPQGPLQAALRFPAGPLPPKAAVLIIPGSGPTDRDGNSPHVGNPAIYSLLAAGLAQRGIASARIDKRGMFGSAAAIPDANAVRMRDYADDALKWSEALRERTGVDCVWILGHSEGGVVALLAGQERAAICGLILVATPGRPMGEVLREQLRANPANAPVLEQALGAIDALEAGRRVDVTALHPALHLLFHAGVQDFLIDSLTLDPSRLASSVQGPMLILQGSRDLQVSVEDAQRLHRSAPQSTLAVLEGVNHVLKAVATDDRDENIATYVRADLPLAPGVVDVIAEFVVSAAPSAR